ncbi:MAG: hypothetical protein HY658_07955 [Actinobacteria bacterium]|nr:hypothetical protein [Actinomycetota bacterium]
MALVASAALALSACAADVPGPRGTRERPRKVVIRIEHSAFLPEEVGVAAGETVRFVLENGDPIGHEFILGDAALQDVHERGTEAHHGDRPGEVSVPSGGTAETTFTFGGGGTLIFGCHLPGHYAYGMRGTVRVA